MPFPFLPAGALVAASVLIAALTAFGLILRAMDRAIVGVRDMAVASIVSGFRGWSNGRSVRIVVSSPGASSTSPSGPAGAPEIVELANGPTEAAARR